MPSFSKLMLIAEGLADTGSIPSVTPGPARACHLRVAHGLDFGAPRTFELASGGSAELGRGVDSDAGLQLGGAEVSRRHARVEHDGRAWRIVDLKSRNGVFVDGQRVAHTALHDGAIIRIGGVVLVFVDTEASAGEPRRKTSRVGGVSQHVRGLRIRCEQLAAGAGPILVTGEAGTGKLAVAEELHELSGRRGPLVVVDCRAIRAESGSVLFGESVDGVPREPGAGLWRSAHGGTVVLDEIGELPLLLQTRLVRALARAIDVRVVCTSSRDLAGELRAGRFHPDLYAALTARRLDIAPLRLRRDDVLPLVARIARNCRLTAHVAEALALHAWPGNVRELEQVISAALVRTAGSRTIRLEHLPRALAARLDPARRPAEPGEDQDDVPAATKATR